jgi:hypothetical protein
MSEENKNTRHVPPPRWVDWAKDVLVILVFPLMLWAVRLEVGNAQQDLKIIRIEQDLTDVNDIDTRVQQNAVQLARLEGKIDTANGRLDEIRTMLLEK